ncbi:MAG: hypothetical protein L0211_02585 [Planctomycetaceae bacterium]|nr:hypothetical protein [Planctomycetaceae bacterium]
MSTATNPSYVIDARADAKLNEISSEFADAILAVAASRTSNRDSQNRPLVDACDIEDAARVLCEVIQRARTAGGKLPPESEQVLQHLQAVCSAFQHECEQSFYPDDDE